VNRFAALLDRLAYEPSRLGKLRLMTDYFRNVEDPDRGYALAGLTGALNFRHAKPALIRTLIYERIDPVLFNLSYDFVGDLSETVALLWPPAPAQTGSASPQLAQVIDLLEATSKLELPGVLSRLLDALDETGRWALLKLITGSLRVGVSARLAKHAVADLGGHKINDVEDLWHGLAPPYLDLFAWLEGREPRPDPQDPARFCPAMLAHPLTEADLETLTPRPGRGRPCRAGQHHPTLFAHRRRHFVRFSRSHR
jgi:DNA ligase-1